MPRSYEQIRQSLTSKSDISTKLSTEGQLIFKQPSFTMQMRKDHDKQEMVLEPSSKLDIADLQRPNTTGGLYKPSMRGVPIPRPGTSVKGTPNNQQRHNQQKQIQDSSNVQQRTQKPENSAVIQKSQDDLMERLKEQSLLLQQKESQIRGLIEELDVQCAENRRLRKQFDQLNSELLEAKRDLKTSSEEAKVLKQQLEQSIGRAGGAANETEKLKQAQKRLETFVDTQKIEISQLKQQLAEKGQQATAAALAHQNTQNELRAANELLRTSNEQRQQLQKKLQEQSEATTQETAELRQQLSSLQAVNLLVDGFRLELGRQEHNSRKMSLELAQLRLIRDRAAEDKERTIQLEQELQTAQKTILSQQQTIRQIETQNQDQNEEIIKLQKKLEHANTEFARNISQQISQKAEVARLTDRAINLQDQSKVSLEQCRLLSIERTKLEAENASLSTENAQNQSKIAKLLSDIDQLNNKIWDMTLNSKTQLVEIKGLEQKIADKDEMLQELISYELAVDEERGTYLGQIADLKTQNSIQTTTIERLTQQIDALNQKQNSQNAKMVELRFEIAKLQQREQREQSLEKQLRSKTVEVTRQRQKILELEGQVQNMKVQLQVACKKYVRVGKLPGVPSSSASSANLKKTIESNAFGIISKNTITKETDQSPVTQDWSASKEFNIVQQELQNNPAKPQESPDYVVLDACKVIDTPTNVEVEKEQENNELQEECATETEPIQQTCHNPSSIQVGQLKQTFNPYLPLIQANETINTKYDQLLDQYSTHLGIIQQDAIQSAYETIQNDFI